MDDDKDHDVSLHLNYYNEIRNKVDFIKYLNENKYNHEFLTEVLSILNKYRWNDDKTRALNEINTSRSKYDLNHSWFINYEINKIVDEHFSLEGNGDVIDLMLESVAGHDLSKLKEQLGVDDERISKIRAATNSNWEQWQTDLTS